MSSEDGWKSTKSREGQRMMYTPSGKNLTAISCKHYKGRSNGACGACFARHVVLVDAVRKLLEDCQYLQAAQLIDKVMGIAQEDPK